jgi:predicted nucleotidyltransferase
MSEERNTLGNEAPGSEGENAAVASAGEPSEPLETRDLSADEVEGVSPEELDEREQRFTRPRKEMGPTTDYRAETTPEETPEEGS